MGFNNVVIVYVWSSLKHIVGNEFIYRRGLNTKRLSLLTLWCSQPHLKFITQKTYVYDGQNWGGLQTGGLQTGGI